MRRPKATFVRVDRLADLDKTRIHNATGNRSKTRRSWFTHTHTHMSAVVAVAGSGGGSGSGNGGKSSGSCWGCCCCCCWQLARLPPRRVKRFQGCNVLKLEFWHMAVWTKILRCAFRIGFCSDFLKRTCSCLGLHCAKTRFLAHGSLDFHGYLSHPWLFRFRLFASVQGWGGG